MGLLDANVTQIVSSSSSFVDQAAMMRSTIGQAESTAMASQALHQGDSAIAFQGAHARFVEAAAKINQLLDLASTNLGEGAGTYTVQDGEAASDYGAAAGVLPTTNL